MIIKVRTNPISVYYLTGDDARQCREDTQGEPVSDDPCFATASFGQDGFAWDTAEEFEADYRASYGGMEPAVAMIDDDRR